MKKYITAVVYRVGYKPEVREIRNTLREMQEIVGGYIEVIQVRGTKNVIIVNEEGLLLNLEPNRPYRNQYLYGDFFIVGTSGEEFTDVDLENLPKAPDLVVPYWQQVKGRDT